MRMKPAEEVGRWTESRLFCHPSGSMSSPWVGIRTLEASPADLANFTVEQREQGRALLLSWDQPSTPNGVITVPMNKNTEHTHKCVCRIEQMTDGAPQI